MIIHEVLLSMEGTCVIIMIGYVFIILQAHMSVHEVHEIE